MFPPGSRVRFFTTRGEMLAIVLGSQGAVSSGVGEVYSFHPDCGEFPVMLLRVRSLKAVDEADESLVVEA